jgi:hypothetical protein
VSRVRDVVGPTALLLAAFCAILVFLPPQGQVGAPLHDRITMLLGPATFVLPLGLAFVGLILTVQRVHPTTALPRTRVCGVALVAFGVIAAEHLMGATSLVGEWLTAWLLDLLGLPLTVFALGCVIGAGTWLAFDVHLPRRRKSDAAAG